MIPIQLQPQRGQIAPVHPILKKEASGDCRVIQSPLELLTFDNPRRSYLERLIEDEYYAVSHGSYFREPKILMTYDTNFHTRWDKVIQDKKNGTDFTNFISSRIKGDYFLDLAGGDSSLAGLAKELGAHTYINVDLGTNREHQFGYCGPSQKSFVDDDNFKSWEVKMDALDFVSSLPSNSFPAITINGLDYYTIPHHDYHLALASEIVRVLSSDGIAFGITSGVMQELESQTGISDLTSIYPIIGSRHEELGLFLKQ